MTTINHENATLQEFEKACAAGRGLDGGLSIMAARGKLGLLAKAIEELADAVVKAGYVPAELKADHDYHDRLAKSVQDREIAGYHREKARQIKSQMGEDVQR
jgi:hypothetical protein